MRCVKRFTPCFNPDGSDLCACGLDVGDIEARMGKFAVEGITVDGLRARAQKESDERGRTNHPVI